MREFGPQLISTATIPIGSISTQPKLSKISKVMLAAPSRRIRLAFWRGRLGRRGRRRSELTANRPGRVWVTTSVGQPAADGWRLTQGGRPRDHWRADPRTARQPQRHLLVSGKLLRNRARRGPARPRQQPRRTHRNLHFSHLTPMTHRDFSLSTTAAFALATQGAATALTP